MSRIRKIATAAGTFSVALGIGFVMQNGDALASRFGEGPGAGQPTAALAPQVAAVTAVVMAPVEQVATVTGVAVVTMSAELAGSAPMAQAMPHEMPVTEVAVVMEQPATAVEMEPARPVTAVAVVMEQPATTVEMEPAGPVTAVAVVMEQPATTVEMEPAGPLTDVAVVLAEPVAPTALEPAFAVTEITVIMEQPQPSLAPTVPMAEGAPVTLAALDTAPEPALPDSPPAIGDECLTTMTASVAPMAMVALALHAPCAPGSVVTIHHQGMMFSATTDVAGRTNLMVPALAVAAVFVADLGAGEGAVAVVDVPEAALVDRAVLQWQATDGLGLHAYEFGAGFGEAGHVWAAATGNSAATVAGTGGFLMQLGDVLVQDALLAQVYTYPSGSSRKAGEVALVVEAEVTVANCGRQIAAQSIQMSPGAAPFTFELAMTMPGCEAVGEFLVLQDMLLDLTLAMR